MSELTQCNYCSMKDIKREAKGKGHRVVTREGTGQLGGINVYILPPGVEMAKVIKDDDEFSKKYFVAWFMKLSESCVC